MTYGLKRGVLPLTLMMPVLLAGCVSQGKYDDLQAQNQQLQQQNAALSSQVAADQDELPQRRALARFLQQPEHALDRDVHDRLGRFLGNAAGGHSLGLDVHAPASSGRTFLPDGILSGSTKGRRMGANQ